MQIQNNTVVTFHYQLRDVDGDYSEDSRNGQPPLYLHGYRGILPALEDKLTGMAAGESVSVTLQPEQAYGPRRDDAVQRIPIKHLMTKGKPKVGTTVTINTKGKPVNAVVTKVGKFNVDVDMNHPLAGKTLQFDVDIVDVRDATMEEIAHRHAHGPGGHQH